MNSKIRDDEKQLPEQPLSPGWFGRMLSPASWWRNPTFLHVSGAVLLFLGGLGLSPLFALDSWNLVVTGFFIGVSGALWIESWWACLIAPMTFGAGYAIRQALGSGFDAISLTVLALSICFGAAFCIAFFKRGDLWQRIKARA